MCKSLILVGSFSLYGQCVYVIMSVCHYVIMLVLSSAHYGQCVVGCLYIYVNSTLVSVVMSSLFSCQCIWGCLHILVNVGLGFVVRSSLPVRSSSFPRNCQLLSMVSKICVSMQISPLYPFILYTLYYPNIYIIYIYTYTTLIWHLLLSHCADDGLLPALWWLCFF